MIQALIWFLSIFFLIGTFTNGYGPQKIREEYARWGYPSWFRYVTAVLELAVALLLLFPAGIGWGALLGMGVMSAVHLTLLHHHETLQSIGPAVIFALLVIVLWQAALPS